MGGFVVELLVKEQTFKCGNLLIFDVCCILLWPMVIDLSSE